MILEELDFLKYKKLLASITYLERPGGFHMVKGDTLAIEKEFGEMLLEAVEKSKPRKIVELGTGYGYSTCWLLLGTAINGHGDVITFDKTDRTPKIYSQFNMLQELPVRLQEYHGDFRELDIFKEVDFLFHDSEHQIEKITADLDYWIERMTPKAQIWIHDANGSVGEGIKKYFDNKKEWCYKQIDKSWGMGIAIRE